MRRSSSPSAKHRLLPLDDCLYALQATIPHPDAVIIASLYCSRAKRPEFAAKGSGTDARIVVSCEVVEDEAVDIIAVATHHWLADSQMKNCGAPRTPGPAKLLSPVIVARCR